jgi:hypothetical protein
MGSSGRCYYIAGSILDSRSLASIATGRSMKLPTTVVPYGSFSARIADSTKLSTRKIATGTALADLGAVSGWLTQTGCQ